MTQPVTADRPSTAIVRLCPNCHRVNAGDRNLCNFCFANIEDAAWVAPPRPPSRWLAAIPVVLALIAALAIGTPIYRTYLVGPEAPLPPSSTTRSAAAADLARARASAHTVDLDAPIAWRQRLPAPLAAPLVTDAARAYASTADGRLLALSLEDGRALWSLPVPGQLDHGPTVAGDLLYVGLRGGQVVAVEPASGRTRWAQSLGGWVSTAPLVLHGVVYVGADQRLVALDAERGDVLWIRDLEFTVVASPVATTRGVAIATNQALVIFDRATGEETYHLNLRSTQALAAAGGAVFELSPQLLAAVEEDSRRPWWDPVRVVWFNLDLMGLAPRTPPPPTRWVALNPPEAALRAGFRATWPLPHPPALDGERAYISWPRGAARALDLTSGAVAWERIVEPAAAPPYVTASGLLWLGKGALILLDPRTGAERARRAFPGAELRDLAIAAQSTLLATDDEVWLLRR